MEPLQPMGAGYDEVREPVGDQPGSPHKDVRMVVVDGSVVPLGEFT